MKIKVVSSDNELRPHEIPIGTILDVVFQDEEGNVIMVVYNGEDVCLFPNEYEETK